MNNYDINTTAQFVNHFSTDISNEKLFDIRLERAIEREVTAIARDYAATNDSIQFLTINWEEIATELALKGTDDVGEILDRLIPAIVKEIILRYNPTALFPEGRKYQLSENQSLNDSNWLYIED